MTTKFLEEICFLRVEDGGGKKKGWSILIENLKIRISDHMTEKIGLNGNEC